MSTIFIYTQAYNAEKTLERTINSVLNQTHTDFIYYILDNASNDGTRDIIRKFANADKRIVHLHNRENGVGNSFWRLIRHIRGDYYVSYIDADDEYYPTFFEKMLLFVKENDLDVASCGTDWYDIETGEIIKRKVIDKTVLLEGTGFADEFSRYRNFMVTLWGALYSPGLLRKVKFKWSKHVTGFADTAVCMEIFQNAKRAGVIAESLHKYNISPGTASYKYNPHWFSECKYIHKISRDYLLHYGPISKENEDYLYVLFLILVKYILPRIQKANVCLNEKINCLYKIFSDNTTQYVLQHWKEIGLKSSREDFEYEIRTWFYAQNEWLTYRETIEKIVGLFDKDR